MSLIHNKTKAVLEKIGKPDEEQRERERLFFCVSIIVDPQCHVTTVVLLQLALRNVEREREREQTNYD